MSYKTPSLNSSTSSLIGSSLDTSVDSASLVASELKSSQHFQQQQQQQQQQQHHHSSETAARFSTASSLPGALCVLGGDVDHSDALSGFPSSSSFAAQSPEDAASRMSSSSSKAALPRFVATTPLIPARAASSYGSYADAAAAGVNQLVRSGNGLAENQQSVRWS